MKEKASASGKQLFLIDAMSFIFRAYHAMPPLTNKEGVPTGAVMGFCNMIYNLLDNHQPDYLAAVFDTSTPTFRKEMYPEYKAHRPPPPEDLIPQFPLVRELIQAFRIPLVSKDGYEADDAIATLVKAGRAAGMQVTIVSSDKDLMQLAGDGVRLLDTMKGRVFDPEAVEEKFGVRPEQLGDWLAMVGDAADNIPGIPGVGPKTATTLLKAHGDLETVLANPDQAKGPKLRQNLVDFADQARLSRKLVTLDENCPIDTDVQKLKRVAPDDRALWDFFGEMDFNRVREKVKPGSALNRSLYQTVFTQEELSVVVDAIKQSGEFAIDLETTSLNAVAAKIVGFCLCWGNNKACYIPVGHRYLGHPKQLSLKDALATLAPLLTDPNFPKYGQNHKYDWIVLKNAGVDMKGVVCDPMLASYVVNPARNVHGLDALALEHLGHTMLSFKEVAGKDTFDLVEIDKATEYAAEDAEATFRLAAILGPRVREDDELGRIFDELELPLARILGEMELYGCGLDVEFLGQLSREAAQQIAELEAAIHAEAGWEVNINSPKQLQKLLFDQLGLTPGKKTKTGYSTDANVLASLAYEHPVAAQIEEYRTYAKLKGTYLDALPALVNRDTGRIHTSYNQAVAATGRLSSSDPNLQNIPIRTTMGRQIRRAFVAPKGYQLLAADYSQIELRVLAHLSKDPVLVDAFKRGQDVHTRTAMEVFGVQTEDVTSEQRRVAKAVNFGVIYGQSDWGLAGQLGISRGEASQYIDDYFERYAGVQTFMDESIDEVRATGISRTLLGRRRPIPDINSKRHNLRGYAERVARNTPIQGSAADLIKMAMIRVDAAIKATKLDVKMILTVHDELIFEVPEDLLDEVEALVVASMTEVMELDVPLKVDVGIGPNWAEAK